MYIWGFLTKALIWRPKRLKDGGWEHKHGFFVAIDAKVALSLISQAKSERNRLGIRYTNHSVGMEYSMLRDRAESLLYKIESSQNNYIDFACVFGGFYLLANIVYAIPVIWEHPYKDAVQYFLICLGLFICAASLYFVKRKIDKRNIDHFLDIEDALYLHEYQRSQY